MQGPSTYRSVTHEGCAAVGCVCCLAKPFAGLKTQHYEGMPTGWEHVGSFHLLEMV